MREFCKFSPKFWMKNEIRKLIEQGSDVAFVALYLQTNHHSHSLGIYFIPLEYIARDTGIKIKRIKEIVECLINANFCQYDYSNEYIWLIKYGVEQAGGPLKESDNRTTQLQSYFEDLPSLSFVREFYLQHKDDFHLKAPLKMESSNEDILLDPLLASPKELRSKEKEKKKGKEKEKKNNNEKNGKEGGDISLEVKLNDDSPEGRVFNHWKTIMNHPQAQLDTKRKELIRMAIKTGYDESQLCQAITGCSYTPHNMGENERGERFDGLNVILRDGNQIDRFISNYHSPPKRVNKGDELMRNNVLAVQSWLEEPEEPFYERQ